MMRTRVNGDTDISGTCKSGVNLLNTIPDTTPPQDNCFFLVSRNNHVAAGRHDLSPDSPIQETISRKRLHHRALCGDAGH
ncbi:hypothetical protein J6590_083247 [Homalodisca vitripennis]|nr:hypothetical protein J6590_083247 [Homalodisca vitripennis]